jgi:hypothetical protein
MAWSKASQSQEVSKPRCITNRRLALIARTVECCGKRIAGCLWNIRIALPYQLQCFVMAELLAGNAVLPNLFEEGFNNILEPTKQHKMQHRSSKGRHQKCHNLNVFQSGNSHIIDNHVLRF